VLATGTRGRVTHAGEWERLRQPLCDNKEQGKGSSRPFARAAPWIDTKLLIGRIAVISRPVKVAEGRTQKGVAIACDDPLKLSEKREGGNGAGGKVSRGDQG